MMIARFSELDQIPTCIQFWFVAVWFFYVAFHIDDERWLEEERARAGWTEPDYYFSGDWEYDANEHYISLPRKED